MPLNVRKAESHGGKVFLYVLILLSQVVFAEPQAYVWTKGHPGTLQKKFFRGKPVRMLDSVEEKRLFAEDGYLMPRERAALFHRLNLEPALVGMDDMDKDMLVMDARALSLAKMQKIYPRIPADKLVRLRKELGAKK
jgi:hypothetical protein